MLPTNEGNSLWRDLTPYTQSTTQNFQIPLGIKLLLDYCGASISIVSIRPPNLSSIIIEQSNRNMYRRRLDLTPFLTTVVNDATTSSISSTTSELIEQ